jgi:hypothetical protein
VDERELARACHQAGVRHHTTPKQVEAVLARRPKTPGAAKLRRVLRGDAKDPRAAAASIAVGQSSS